MQNNVGASEAITNNVGGAGAGAGNEGNDNSLPESLGGGQSSSGANSTIGNSTGLLVAPSIAPTVNHNQQQQQHQQSRPAVPPANQQLQHHHPHHHSGGHLHGGHMQHHQHHPQVGSSMHHHPYVTPSQPDNSGYQHHPHQQQQRAGGGGGGGSGHHHAAQSYHHNQQPQHQMQHYHHQPPTHHHNKQKYDGHPRRNHSDNESNLNHVLLITVINPHYPINCSLIHQICSPYGKVNRIVIFKKNGVQAMVEFDNLESAKRAKSMLYGCDIYSGCCTLKIEYAKPSRLNIHKNDDDSYDYTNPNPGNSTNSSAQEDTASVTADANNSSNSTGLMVAATGSATQSAQPSQNQSRPAISPGNQQLPQHQASSGHPLGGQLQHHHHHQMSSNMHHPYVDPSQPDNSGYQHHHQQQRGHHAPQNYHHNQQQQPQQQMHHSTVMMVYGLLTERVNCDRLFNLFCLYGNVVRVKFLKTKEGCAMVQMGDILAVDRCISSLNKMTLFDSELQISYSKQAFLHDVIQPFILPDGSPSFKDFMGNKNNRFKNPEVASKNRILPPSPVLHFFNAPYGITEDEIVHLFKFTAGHEPISIKIFTPKVENIKSYSGLITFKDPGEAAEALVMCNHLTMPKPGASSPYILRLCFSPPSFAKAST